MHTLAAFYQSVANGVTYSGVNGVIDQSLTLDAGNRIQAPGPWQIIGAYAAGANLTAARVNAPSLRTLVLPEIYPAATAVAPPSPAPFDDMENRGPRLVSGEYFQVEVSRGGAGASDVFAGVWFTNGYTPAPTGPTFTLVGTVTPTLTVGTWVLATPVFNQTLPAGRYAIVGMAAVQTNGIFCRLAFPGNATYRPGVVTNPTYGNVINGDPFRYGRFGHYGEFEFNVPPNVEVMGTAAGAQALTIYLDIIKIR